MQMGLNTEISRQGKALHIQTEDSGREHCTLISHLFLSGGILVTERSHYTEETTDEEISMQLKAQHRDMLNAVMSGRYDRVIVMGLKQSLQKGPPLARDRAKNASSEGPPLAHDLDNQSPAEAKATPHPQLGGLWPLTPPILTDEDQSKLGEE